MLRISVILVLTLLFFLLLTSTSIKTKKKKKSKSKDKLIPVDEFHIALGAKIAPGAKDIDLKEQLSACLALQIYRDNMQDRSLLYTPTMTSSGEMPILHHILNIYMFGTKIHEEKECIVMLLIDMIDTANDPYLVDQPEAVDQPSLLLKALIAKEINLARTILKYTQSFNSDKITYKAGVIEDLKWSEIYGTTCETIPPSKFFIKVDAESRRERALSKLEYLAEFKDNVDYYIMTNATEDLENMLNKLTVMSFNTIDGASPIINNKDMKFLSSSYVAYAKELVKKQIEHINNRDEEDDEDEIKIKSDIHLLAVNNMLSEVMSNYHGPLLNKVVSGGGQGKTSGVYRLTKSITSSEPEAKYKTGSGNEAINHKEYNVRQVFHGNEGRNALHLLSLSTSFVMLDQVVDVYKNEAPKFITADQLSKIYNMLFNALIKRDVNGFSPVYYSYFKFGLKTSFAQKMLEFCKLVGFSDELIETEFNVTLTNEGNIDFSLINNDIKTLEKNFDMGDSGGWLKSSIPSSDPVHNIIREDTCQIDQVEFISTQDFVQNYFRRSRPLLVRNGINQELKEKFNKKNFIDNYGHIAVNISSIPYANSFGESDSAMNLKLMADNLSNQSPKNYVFTVADSTWKEKLDADCEIPRLLPIGTERDTNQFFLGPPGSGAPVHHHGDAVNSLVYGKKQWFLYKPSDTFYSSKNSKEFITYDVKAKLALQCTQYAGDLMYVPGSWGHGTLNLQSSIGVAHEFHFGNFCMM